MRCRPGGSPASSKRPSESETAKRCTAGTETITPASGRPLNVELAVPRMVAAESSCEATEAGSMPAATSSAAAYHARSDMGHLSAKTFPLIPQYHSLFTPFPGFTRRLALSLTYPLLGAFHRTWSPMTEGRWHESSVRDGLHF